MCTGESKMQDTLKELEFAKTHWNKLYFLFMPSKQRWPAKVEKIIEGATTSDLILTNSQDRAESRSKSLGWKHSETECFKEWLRPLGTTSD